MHSDSEQKCAVEVVGVLYLQQKILIVTETMIQANSLELNLVS